MKLVFFYHSLLSDWNHGNAHFLRGIATELLERGHEVVVYEPADGWSFQNLLSEHGEPAIESFHAAYPKLSSRRYLPDLDLDEALEGAALVLVHEWNQPWLVKAIGAHRASHPHLRLLFHDTHHRAVTARPEMAAYDLSHYDGVLAYGDVLRELYLGEGWIQRAWTWHEAADTRLFHPIPSVQPTGDLIWIGNWGDEERTAELHEFLIRPVKALQLNAQVFGVRFPLDGRHALADAGIVYGGWLPNFRVPELFAQFRVTIHVPRQPYTKHLPGIPTIRPFEALACGIPLISAPMEGCDHLLKAGEEYLSAANGSEMQRLLSHLLNDRAMAAELAARGLAAIRGRHTCAHRVDELLTIAAELGLPHAP